jgi:peptidoglycan-associated lipoprotein
MMTVRAQWRIWALATLMVWMLFGCSRCRRGEELTPLETQPLAPAETTGMEGTELGERPLGEPGEIIAELEIVYFDYDSDALDESDRAALERNAEWLRDHADLPVLVEGHCDERGTDEYNYSLGERRANSVLGYLQELGVPTQLATRSYGETRPAREGHDEEAWRWNRRVQFSSYAD